MSYRIGIVGCAGSGKSTLAQKVADELGVPCLKSKRITMEILERDGYDYSSGIQVERFLANAGRQSEILRRTLEVEAEQESFVTDRTVVDLAAYAVCEMHQCDTKALENVFQACSEAVKDYTHLVLCEWNNGPIGRNDKRTLNPWYQFLVHALEVGIMDYWDCEYMVIKAGDLDERFSKVMEKIG